MINAVMVSGNIANDPKAFGDERKALRFTIANNEYIGDGNERVNYFDCVIFGKRADALTGILAKGMKVSIFGKLRQSNYKDNAGNSVYKVDIVVDEIELPRKA